MIIPIRCKTCNKILADVWEYYKMENMKIEKREIERGQEKPNDEKKYKYLENTTFAMDERNKLMNKLGITRYCCRSVLLTHVDIIDNMS